MQRQNALVLALRGFLLPFLASEAASAEKLHDIPSNLAVAHLVITISGFLGETEFRERIQSLGDPVGLRYFRASGAGALVAVVRLQVLGDLRDGNVDVCHAALRVCFSVCGVLDKEIAPKDLQDEGQGRLVVQKLPVATDEMDDVDQNAYPQALVQVRIGNIAALFLERQEGLLGSRLLVETHHGELSVKAPFLFLDAVRNNVAEANASREGHESDDIVISDFLIVRPPARQVIVIFFKLPDIPFPKLGLLRQSELGFSHCSEFGITLDDAVRGHVSFRRNTILPRRSQSPANFERHLARRSTPLIPTHLVHEAQYGKEGVIVRIDRLKCRGMIVFRLLLRTQRVSLPESSRKCD